MRVKPRGCLRGFPLFKPRVYTPVRSRRLISRRAAEAGGNNDEKPPQQPGGFAPVQVEPRAVCGAFRLCCCDFQSPVPNRRHGWEQPRLLTDCGSSVFLRGSA